MWTLFAQLSPDEIRAIREFIVSSANGELGNNDSYSSL